MVRIITKLHVVVTILLVHTSSLYSQESEPAEEPDQATLLYNQAVSKAEWLDWENSIPLLDEAIALKPDFADAWRQRGIAKMNLEQLDEALADLDEAIKLQPDSAESHFARGSIHSAAGDLAKAIENYDQAIQLAPDNPDWFYQRGEAQLALGENTKAISNLSEAVRLQPEFESAYRSRAFAYAADGENAKAIEDFKKVVEIDPLEPQDWHNLGVSHLRDGDYAQAIEALSEAIKLNPHRENSLYSRGNAYLESGDRDSALTDFSRVIDINPEKADAWGRRGLILLEKGRDAAARKDFEQCFKLAPDSRAQYAAAIEEIKKTRKIDPSQVVDDKAGVDAPLTPEEAIELYEKAAKAGDVRRVGRLYYEPMATPFINLFDTLVEIGAAKKRLIAAMDARFGRGGSLAAPIPDDAQIREQMTRLVNFVVRSKTPDDEGYVLEVEVTEMRSAAAAGGAGQRGAKSSTQTFLAREQNGIWRVGPRKSEYEIKFAKDTAENMKGVPKIMDELASAVKAGQFVSRYDVEQALIERAAGQLTARSPSTATSTTTQPAMP